MPDAAYSSIEELLHRSGLDIGMWLFTPADAATVINLPRGQRAIGVSYDPSTDNPGNYVITQVAQRYDVLIFVDQVNYLFQLTNSHSKPQQN